MTTGDDHSSRAGAQVYWQRVAQWLDGDDGSGGGDLVPNGVDRRELLKVLGASLALAGASGCERQRREKLLPYTIPPEDMTPGIAKMYATSMELDGFATGILVRSNDGRPTKIEGNPEHPASLGATGVYEQAAVLGLYDPHRARACRHRTNPVSFQQVVAKFSADRADAGRKLRFLLGPTGSPLAADLLRRIQARHPEARFTFHAPVHTPYAAAGGQIAFGVPVQPQYDFSRASVVLAIDADFLASMPFSIRYARQFAERRRTSRPSDPMVRLYAVESMMTQTGAAADHRLSRRTSEIAAVLGAVVAELAGLVDGAGEGLARALAPLRSDRHARHARAIARDLARDPAGALIIVGDAQPAFVHALANLANASLLRSAAFSCIAPTLASAGLPTQTMKELASDMAASRVDTLVMLDTNPVYTAPVDFEFARGLALVEDSLHLGLYENETAERAAWFVPAAHFLESWGDARAYDGTISFCQALIEPLTGGRSVHEILSVFAGDRTPNARTLLRTHWERGHASPDFAEFWQEVVRRGLVPDSASPRLALSPRADAFAEAAREAVAAASKPAPLLEVTLFSDPSVYDGRFANNAWLQELPRPLTKLTWDNAALLSRDTAAKLGVADEDVIEIRRHDRPIRLPVLVAPGHADGAISVHLGYGRQGAEALARGVGANAFVLRSSESPTLADDIEVRTVEGAVHRLALAQLHFGTDDRPIALSATLDEWRANPDFAAPHRGATLSLYDPTLSRREGHQWAMTIDTSICVGCGACVLACQSENNILVVGKENVRKGREMHWLRIDTYYAGPPENPQVLNEPMLCQPCERAPCEYVCPVNATTHSPDGLNEMVYNRCVGTRFCSNNCPYKVRTFNWFDWVEREPANRGLVQLQRNPSVTVRERGVMEKCTYCVQRIRSAEIHARNEYRDIRPGEVVTACSQACPTQAIQFGSLAHTDTKMVQWRNEPRAFSVLHELGTQPRTQYLARIRNPNPEFDA